MATVGFYGYEIWGWVAGGQAIAGDNRFLLKKKKPYKTAKQYSFQLQQTSSKEKAQFLKLDFKLNQSDGQWHGGQDGGHFKWRPQPRYIPQPRP